MRESNGDDRGVVETTLDDLNGGVCECGHVANDHDESGRCENGDCGCPCWERVRRGA